MDHISDTIYTSFPIKKTSNKSLGGCEIIIWTTTPWTIPAGIVHGVVVQIIISQPPRLLFEVFLIGNEV